MFCEKCGTKLPEGSRFCMNCGAKAAIEESIQNAAVHEAAVSIDALVLETGTSAVETETVEIPVEQPAAFYEAAESKPAQEQKEQAPVQPIQELKVQQTPEKAVQPLQAQFKQEVVQQAPVQQTQAQPIPAQSQARPVVQAAQPATVKAAQPIMPQASQPAAAYASQPVFSQSNQQAPMPQNLQQPAFSQNSQQVIAPAQQPGADQKPEKLKPLQTWKFIGMFIITAIPVINLIFVLIWSFGSGFNKNTKSYARAVLILWIVELLLLIITAIVNWALLQSIWSTISSMSPGMPIY
ncbi:MAG TPA: zinc-ribbon domain-containing protein [Clostridia bacterium]|nr:zinc-ribbon domain-containing protein [Clostridia bacterium]